MDLFTHFHLCGIYDIYVFGVACTQVTNPQAIEMPTSCLYYYHWCLGENYRGILMSQRVEKDYHRDY